MRISVSRFVGTKREGAWLGVGILESIEHLLSNLVIDPPVGVTLCGIGDRFNVGPQPIAGEDLHAVVQYVKTLAPSWRQDVQ